MSLFYRLSRFETVYISLLSSRGHGLLYHDQSKGNLVKHSTLGLKVGHLQLPRLHTISNNRLVVKYRTSVTWVLGVDDFPSSEYTLVHLQRLFMQKYGVSIILKRILTEIQNSNKTMSRVFKNRISLWDIIIRYLIEGCLYLIFLENTVQNNNNSFLKQYFLVIIIFSLVI